MAIHKINEVVIKEKVDLKVLFTAIINEVKQPKKKWIASLCS